MNSGTASNQVLAILSTLNEWGIIRYIKAMCFDTTAVNTGIHNSTCKEIEETLGKDLIWLTCRDHMFEIILKSAFEVYWTVLSGVEDTVVAEIVSDTKNEISRFITQCLQQPRDEYKELLELSLIFLGEMPRDKVSFKRPGAVHHARWMAKAIYSLKMFIFRDEFKLSNKELHGLGQFCIFIVIFKRLVFINFCDY